MTLETVVNDAETFADVLSYLSTEQTQALAAKFAAQPKTLKKAVREQMIEGEDYVQYAVFILRKHANDYLFAQMRDVWVQRLEMLIPRVLTSDEKLKQSTETSIASIALEIEDVDMRGEIQTILKKNLLPKSTDGFNLLKCFERTAELFANAWKS